MSDVEVLPEIKEIVGAILFAAKQPVPLAALAAVFKQTADRYGGITKGFAAAGEAEVTAAIAALREDLERAKSGLRVAEVAQGYRIENVPTCGAWLRTFLEKGRPNRLSAPALETLAVIAYRQPAMRSEIEGVRGVAVDQIIRNLLDMQLIRIVGRSELPGRPWLFGTTQKFLEHFGLKNLDDLPGTDELRRLESAQAAKPDTPQMPLSAPSPGQGGEPTGFRRDVDADRPGEDEVGVVVGMAETAEEGDEILPEAPEGIVLGDAEDEAESPAEEAPAADGEDLDAKIAKLYGDLDDEDDGKPKKTKTGDGDGESDEEDGESDEDADSDDEDDEEFDDDEDDEDGDEGDEDEESDEDSDEDRDADGEDGGKDDAR